MPIRENPKFPIPVGADRHLLLWKACVFHYLEEVAPIGELPSTQRELIIFIPSSRFRYTFSD